MRLTLRTLLAWLDDTLPPAEVREIGQMVNDSPFAKELVERIQKVSRQRRLTVPKDDAETSDPNLVAAYLDNTLEADAVTEFEKIALTSDVHLAEVASAHQILSLIGQKAKVPPEARQRMYRLVNGSDGAASVGGKAGGGPRHRVRSDSATVPGLSTKSLGGKDDDSLAPAFWPNAHLTRRPWTERFGPPLLVTGLIGVLGLSAWKSLGPHAEPGAPTQVVQATEPPPPAPPAPPPAPPVLAKVDVAPPPLVAEPVDEPKEPEKAPKLAPVTPEQGVGRVAPGEAVALRFSESNRRWEIVPAEAPVKAEERLVGLAPFRLPLQLGNAKVELIRSAEIRPKPAGDNATARFDLTRGRVVVRVDEPDQAVAVGLGNATLRVVPPADAPVGLERADRQADPDAKNAPALRVFVPEGKATLSAGAESQVVSGPATFQFRPPATFEKLAEPAPPWVSETELSPADKLAGAEFSALFTKGGFPKTVLVQATLDDQEPSVRRLALEALGSIDEVDVVLEALNSPGDPSIRLAAIDVLRGAMNQSPESARVVRDALQDFSPDPAQAATLGKLLAGYSPREARDPKTYEALVLDLEAQELGVRELALMNLRALTGRDRLDYNPDHPEEGNGLRAWQDLQKAGKLVPAPEGRPR